MAKLDDTDLISVQVVYTYLVCLHRHRCVCSTMYLVKVKCEALVPALLTAGFPRCLADLLVIQVKYTHHFVYNTSHCHNTVGKRWTVLAWCQSTDRSGRVGSCRVVSCRVVSCRVRSGRSINESVVLITSLFPTTNSTNFNYCKTKHHLQHTQTMYWKGDERKYYFIIIKL